MIKSFWYALAGLKTLLGTERNARVHLLATAAVILVAAWLRLSRYDWGLIVLAIAIVWAAEALNTAVERLGDAVSGESRDPLVGKAKDVAAAGVLLAAMGAALIGVIILWPRFVELTFGARR